MDNKPSFNLAGPVFTSRPGWGGQLKGWFKRTFEPAPVIGIVGLVAVLSVVHMSVNDMEITDKPLANLTANEKIIRIAEPGQGAIHLARQALDDFLGVNPEIGLTPEQRIYAEMRLADLAGIEQLHPGDTVTFKLSDIENVITAAQELSDSQLKKLMPYIR